MRTLVYTVSDFSIYAEQCINLLFSKIIPEPNTDYCVITNNKPSLKFKYNIINVDFKGNFVGFLKFYPHLPKYDRYLFLDSDIIFVDRVSLLFNEQKNYSIVCDINRPIADQWCTYHIHDKSRLPKNICGLNSGTFAFKSTEILENITEKLYELSLATNTPRMNAKLEQSVFNSFIGEKYNYEWKQCHDITCNTELYADYNTVFRKNITLYHFCGGNRQGNFNGRKGHMFYKYKRMQSFIKSNNI